MLILAPVGEDAEQLEHTITDRNAKMGHFNFGRWFGNFLSNETNLPQDQSSQLLGIYSREIKNIYTKS